MSLRKRGLAAAGFGFTAALMFSSVFAQGMGAGPVSRFEEIDRNDDQRVSSEEHAAWRESVFNAMDADQSGELTETEYMSVRMGPGPRAGTPGPRHAERQAAKRKRFEEMDADGNGTVTKQQFLDHGEQRFKAADADGDGTLTPAEFREYHLKG